MYEEKGRDNRDMEIEKTEVSETERNKESEDKEREENKNRENERMCVERDRERRFETCVTKREEL